MMAEAANAVTKRFIVIVLRLMPGRSGLLQFSFLFAGKFVLWLQSRKKANEDWACVKADWCLCHRPNHFC